MAGPKTLTPLPPGPLTAVKSDAGTRKSDLVYRVLPEEELDATPPPGVRVLPPTYQIQHHLRNKTTDQVRSLDIDFEEKERESWGHSSEIVKKMPENASPDAADDYRSAVLSEGKEIISQG